MKIHVTGCLVLLGLLLLKPAEAQTPADPLGRTTPQGAVVGLIRAANDGNADRAAEYLNSRLQPADRQELALQLGIVLDRYLITSLGSLSNRADGDLVDGLAGRDRVGVVESASGKAEIFLDRVQAGDEPAMWLFASDNLQEIPRLYSDVQPPWIEAYVPASLRTTRWLSIPLYRWIAILLGIPLVFVVASLFTRALTLLLRPLLRRFTHEHDDRGLATIVGPLRLLVLALFFYATSYFGVNLVARRFWERAAATLTVIALCWLSLRLMDVVADLTLKRSRRLNRAGNTALIRLINRLSKAGAVSVAALVLLYMAGIDLTAVLTGLGVGGLAIGFGAQKTIENLFGGIMVITDRPVNVGDMCRAGEFFGAVEDIGVRSTRIRTLDRTVVSIPNGQLATMSLENYTERDRIRLFHTVGLRCQTTADQMRLVLTSTQRLLADHPKVESSSARARFIRLGGPSLDLEISAYILVTDYEAFLAIQEHLLLGIMDIIDASGTAIFSPWGTGIPAPIET